MLLRSTLRVLDRINSKFQRAPQIALIAWDKETLCFIEVKTCSRRNFMPAEAAAAEQKRTALSALARRYLRQYSNSHSEEARVRFDVTSVYLESNGPAEITLFRDAFSLS